MERAIHILKLILIRWICFEGFSLRPCYSTRVFIFFRFRWRLVYTNSFIRVRVSGEFLKSKIITYTDFPSMSLLPNIVPDMCEMWPLSRSCTSSIFALTMSSSGGLKVHAIPIELISRITPLYIFLRILMLNVAEYPSLHLIRI